MKTSEMIAMLEKNPKLKFEQLGEDKEPGSFIYVGARNIIRWGGRNQEDNPLNIVLKPEYSDWQLVREPVPWHEALQAWAERKTIKCNREGQTTTRYSNKETKLNDQYGFSLERDEILTGTWYICKDSPDES